MGLFRNFACAASALAWLWLPAGCAPRPPLGCVLDLPAEIGGPFALLDETGKAVTQADFQGRPALLYFGFTFCPDVCPLSMQSAKLALETAGPLGRSIQPILVTLDPARDHPAALRAYVHSAGFPEGLRGLTGTITQTTALAEAFKVGWGKVGDGPDYVIEHTSLFFVLDRQWKARALYSSDLDPESAAACIHAALR